MRPFSIHDDFVAAAAGGETTATSHMDAARAALAHETGGVTRKMDNSVAASSAPSHHPWDVAKRRASRSPPPPSVLWRRRRRRNESDAASVASSSFSLATAATSASSMSPPPSSMLSPTFTESSLGGCFDGECATSTPRRMMLLRRARGMSEASWSVPPESPITPASLDELDEVEEPVTPKQQQPRTPDLAELTLSHRPRRRRHRQSWDSGVGSDMSGGRHTRGNSLAGVVDELFPWPSFRRVQSVSLDKPLPSVPPSEPDCDYYNTPRPTIESRAPSPFEVVGGRRDEGVDFDRGDCWDETSSQATMPAEDVAGRVLNYTLDVAFGLGSNNVDASRCRSVVQSFIGDLQWAVDGADRVDEPDETMIKQEADADAEVEDQDQEKTQQQPSRTTSSASNATRSSKGSGKAERGKRKSREGQEDNQDGDDGLDEGGAKQREPGPAKRPKLESGVRMSCPYRKKNPLRFNVRDHRLCALTVFTDTAELRRHIQDCHRRPANLPQHRCPRCQVQFSAADALREHLLFRSGVLCPVVEGGAVEMDNNASDLPHDPEDGIDGATAEKLRSKKGRVADSVETQWQKIWGLLFPRDEVLPFEYCAVMEHHELFDKYRSSMPALRGSLSVIGLRERGLETLDRILTNHLIELFEQCNEEGRRKDYRNRQPKAAAAAATLMVQTAAANGQQLRKQSSLRQRLAAAHRDSGFVDDESVGGSSGTPALTSDDGSSPGCFAPAKPEQPPHSAISLDRQHQHHQQQAYGQLDGHMQSLAALTGVLPGAMVLGMADTTTTGQLQDASCFPDYNMLPSFDATGDLGLQYGLDEQHMGQLHGLGLQGGADGQEMPWLTTMTFADVGGEFVAAEQQNSTSAWVFRHPE